jgi:hypothetical protein
MPGREIVYTTNATISTTDVGFVIEANNSSTDTLYVYVPSNATIPFSAQDEIRILRSNTGPVVIAIATGASVSINGVTSGSATIVKEYGLANLIKIDTNSWVVAGDIATGFDTSLDIFTANVPALTDVANIQTAFYNYHYGQPNVVTEFNNLGEGSVAKYLYLLNQKLDASEVGELVFTAIGPTTNLNTITTAAGFYYSPDVINSTAAGLYSYPETKPGILAAYKNASGGFTQTYQSFTTVTGTTPTDNIWMRSTLYNNAATWGNWSQLAKGDITNYFTKTEINNRTLDDVAGVVLSSTVSSGQVLTYNGSNWVNQTPTGLSGYAFFGRYVYTASATLTLPAGIKAANVIAVGGGGGGGGVAGGGTAGPTQPAMSGAGGGGTYIQTFVTVATTTTGFGVTIGAGGAGGSSGGNGSGAATVNTTIVRISTTGSTIVSAPGGSGGSGKSGRGIANGGAGGSGGSFTGTGISVPGGRGGAGTINLYSDAGVDTTDAVKAVGGSSMLSPAAFTDDVNTATNGASYGGGGTGAWTTSSSGSGSGGTGAAGIAIIDLYV